MLDNGSRDGSAEAVRAHGEVDELIALGQRRGKALNDSRAAGARTRALRAAAQRGLRAAAGRDARAVARAAGRTRGPRARARSCCARTARPRPARGAFQRPLTALAGALFLHRLFNVQSKGTRTREVDWCQSSALLVRREAAAAGRLSRRRLLRLLRRGRLRAAAARRRLAQPLRAGRARRAPRAAVQRRGARAADRRAVAQPRPVHEKAPLGERRAGGALADGVELRAASVGRARAAGPLAEALLAPRHRDASPARGEGLREAADAYNATLAGATALDGPAASPLD